MFRSKKKSFDQYSIYSLNYVNGKVDEWKILLILSGILPIKKYLNIL